MVPLRAVVGEEEAEEAPVRRPTGRVRGVSEAPKKKKKKAEAEEAEALPCRVAGRGYEATPKKKKKAAE